MKHAVYINHRGLAVHYNLWVHIKTLIYYHMLHVSNKNTEHKWMLIILIYFV